MKLVVISDTHGQHEKLKIPPGDILLHCGDFSNMGTEQELISLASWLKQQPHEQIFLNPGNHDGMTQEDPARAREILENARPGIRLLSHESLEIGGLKWFFSPWTPEFCGWWWMLEAREIREEWSKIPEDTQVLVTHGPPYMILDTVQREPGVHAGCKELYDRIPKLKQLRHHFFGHLHHQGGQTIERNGVRYTNAAVLNDRNYLQNQPQEFEI